MAVQAVFGTNELLEGILLHLPPKDVVNARRVSGSWKALIDTSISLKRSMFLAPDTDGPLHLVLDAHTLPIFEGKRWLDTYVPPQRGAPIKVLPVFRELVSNDEPCKLFRSEEHPYIHYTSPSPEDVESIFKRYIWMSIPLRLRNRMHDTSLWNQMFLTQPPCTAVCVMFMVGAAVKSLATLRDKRGLTLGMVVEVCRDLLEQFNVGRVVGLAEEAGIGRPSCVLAFRTAE
ncbi:hypothetical protein LTR85_009675 [Meristemomyces frigidus]|nr:hypothetical protein LTR85_009675 [Meristemomyces frigidus]